MTNDKIPNAPQPTAPADAETNPAAEKDSANLPPISEEKWQEFERSLPPNWRDKKE